MVVLSKSEPYENNFSVKKSVEKSVEKSVKKSVKNVPRKHSNQERGVIVYSNCVNKYEASMIGIPFNVFSSISFL